MSVPIGLQAFKNSVKKVLVKAGFRAVDGTDEIDSDLDQIPDAGLIAGFETLSHNIPVRELPGWSVPRRIIVTEASVRRLDWLREVAPESEFISVVNPDDPRVATADVIIGWCTLGMVKNCRSLKWVQINSAGFEWRERNEELTKRGVLLTNLKAVNSTVIAEHAVSLLLALSRGLSRYMIGQRRGLWSPYQAPMENMIQLSGKKVLIVGLGSIGLRIAELLNSFGMEVSGVRNSSNKSPDFFFSVGTLNDLKNLLKPADVVINALPLTDQTQGLFSKDVFVAMKPGVFFINVGRGATVITHDLVTALKTGLIGSAGLDVTEPEPLPRNHALWRMDNVIITPHVASRDVLSRQREWLLIKENLRRYVMGQCMLCVVDLRRGY